MKKYVLVLGLVLVPLMLNAQQHDSVVYNESVVVTGEYNPVLDNSLLKLNVAPHITDTNMSLQHKFEYSITPRRLTSIFQPTRIKAAKIIGEPTTRLYNNYFRLGFGNYWSGLLDAFYNSTRAAKLAYGVQLHHYGSWGSLGHKPSDETLYSTNYWGADHFANSQLGGFVNYILKDNAELSSTVNYENDYNLFYGFNDSTLNAYGINWLGKVAYNRDSISKKDYTSMYNVLTWTGGIRSLNTDVNQLGYDVNLLLSHLWGRPSMSEFRMMLDGTVHYGFPMFKEYKGIAALQVTWDHYGERYGQNNINPDLEQMPLGFSMPMILANQTFCFGNVADTDRWNKEILTLHPYVDFLFRNFKFHVGARGIVDAFSVSDAYEGFVNIYSISSKPPQSHLTADRFYFFPDVVVNKNFMNDAMSLSAGLTGGVDANSWNAIRLINPYVAPNQQTSASRHFDVFANMRFDFSKKLGMNLNVEYSWLNDALGFRLHPYYHLDNVYEICYVDLSQLTLGGNFSFVNDELLQMEVGGNYYNYASIKEGNGPVYRDYRPTFDAHLNAKVNYKNKVRAQLQTLLLSRVTAESTTNPVNGITTADTLPVRFGIGLNVEYIHTRAISFFLNLDNIAAQRYFLWKNYPSHRFTAMIGMTYTIPTKKH